MSAASSAHTLRPRSRAPPSFPRDRDQREHQQAPPQHPSLQIPMSPRSYFMPNNPPYLDTSLADLESWRLQQSFHAAAMNGLPPVPRRTSSRGTHPQSPIDATAAKILVWDSPNSHYPPSSRQQFRRKSITSNTSSSDHHHLRSPRPSRSPSPAAPRNSNCARPPRTPMTHEYTKRPTTRRMTGQSNSGSNNPNSGCVFETALVNSRRRIPYSVGSEALAVVPPGSYQSRLDERDERCLSVDILDLYHVCLI
jgi:hypothetical protein